MKNKSMIVAALLFVSTVVAFAGVDEPNNNGFAIVPVKGNQIFKVIYKNEVASRVKLTVKNEVGSIVFAESLQSANGFIRPLNFLGLPAGEYTIEVSDASGKKIEKVSYHPKSVIKQVHVSKLAAETGKYLMAISSNGEEEISINIIDSENKLVYTENRTIVGDFAQVFKLDANAASYTFQVVDKTGNIKTIKF
jgi:hypothetical protein